MKQILRKYGKTSKELIELKDDFFTNNSEILSEEKRINNIYIKQQKRKECKNCNDRLGDSLFTKLKVPYTFCERCGHLNGLYEDSFAFANQIYANSDRHFNEYKENIDKRLDAIYTPKADFLFSVLEKEGVNPKNLSYCDFGCGNGLFLLALKKMGINKLKGYEVSLNEVEFSNELFQEKTVEFINMQETLETVHKLDSEVISLIGVLEHLQDPRAILSAIETNKKIKYVFIAVPMFSINVFIELVFQDQIAPRNLTGDHTHLYTEKSIDWFCKEFNFQKIGEWWFGTDMVDFYRSVFGVLDEKMRKLWTNTFKDLIDDLQVVVDKHHLSSEFHFVLKKDLKP